MNIARATLATLSLCACFSAAVQAEEYPSRPIRVIVPFAAGGGSDILTRFIATHLADVLKQSVVVDNRAGGGGIVGTLLGAKATPDGYTLVETAATTLAVLPAMTSVPYDAMKDFAPVVLIGSSPQILVVYPGLPIRSVKDLVDYAKAKPDALNYGSSGNGGSAHLGAELLKSAAGIRMTHVPYKGNGPALLDLVAGRVQLALTSMVGTMPHIKADRLRPLAITSIKRSKIMPELPTIAEAGYPGCEVASWYGLLAPARTPHAIVSKLNGAVAQVLRRPEVMQRLNADGVEAGGESPAAFAAFIKDEIAKWGRVVKAAGIKLDQ